MRIAVKRVYEAASGNDGYRVLVDRLWPRGIKKENLAIDEWNKEIAPSNELRKNFHNKQLDFSEFSRLYTQELQTSQAPEELLGRGEGYDVLTLLYAAKDVDQNHALVLRDHLGAILRDKT